MKVVAIALILVVLAVVVLWFGDNLFSVGPGGLFRNEVTLLILLLSIPISLSLFFFLSLRQQEKDPQQQQEDDSSQ
jgi:uncharacterized membrane protein